MPELITWTEHPGDPIQIAAWKHAPEVVVCMRAMFSEERIKSAIHYWEALGYHFASVSFDSLRSECEGGDLAPGMIVITDNVTPDEDYYLARTFLHMPNGNGGARIEVKPDADSATGTRTWMGHALGWNHAARRGHLMCADYSHDASEPVVEHHTALSTHRPDRDL